MRLFYSNMNMLLDKLYISQKARTYEYWLHTCKLESSKSTIDMYDNWIQLRAQSFKPPNGFTDKVDCILQRAYEAKLKYEHAGGTY